MSLRDELARTIRRIYEFGMTTTSGGNLSIRADDGGIWITPAGLDKGTLAADAIAHVEPSGSCASACAPSSELPFHRAVYAARRDLRAIVHAHPVSLVAFSVAHQVPDTRISTHAYTLCGKVGFAPYARPGSDALGERIAAAFASGCDCVVLENHGVVIGGRSLREAFERLEALDLTARTILRARTIGTERPLSTDELRIARRPVPQPDAGGGGPFSSRENDLREQLCSFARRSHVRRLMTTTQGVLSARLADGVFLMTPRHLPLDGLGPADLLRIRSDEEVEACTALHRAVYQAHAEVGAIAHGHPESAGGFSVSGAPLPSRTIPESYILVRDPVTVPFQTAQREPEKVAELLTPEHPVALIDNDGALTLGRSVLEAFDRLEVLEATAAAVIASRPLGDLTEMSENVILELRKAFFPDGGL